MAADSLAYRWASPDQGQGYSDPNAPGAPESVTPSMPASYVNPNLWGAIGRAAAKLAHGFYDYAGSPSNPMDIVPGAVTHAAGDIGMGLYNAGPKVIGDILSGRLQPGTPEFNEAARNMALTYGLPGGAPAEEGVVSAGMKVPKGRVKPAEGGTFQAKAPMIGQGTATPLFDTSRLTERPDVPQGPIERMPPPAKGVPDWFASQIHDPKTAQQYEAVLKKGIEVGGKENTLGWWNTMPLRERYLGEFGAERGDPEWRSGMKMWSATSPRHPFPANIRQASYFGNLLAEGKPLPELVKKYREGQTSGAFNMVPTTQAPPGYANFPLHIQNIGNLYDPETGLLTGKYPLTNPKPASMDQNLLGNWGVPTIDVRDLKAMGLKTKGGEAMQSVDPASLYGYTEEQFHQPLAEKLGLDPAQMQSSTWVGVPEYFNEADRSGTLSAVGTLEDSIRRTAAATGLTPEQVLSRFFFRKEGRLLQAGDPISAAVSEMIQQSQQQPDQGQDQSAGP